MDAATYWTAIGSVGTAAGSLLALLTLLLTIFLFSRQRNDERAAQIREDIRSFVSSTASLARVLRDGSPLISAAWAARAIIQESLPVNPDIEDLREAVRDGGIGLSVAVVSWERSSEAEVFRNLLGDLVASSRRMSGDLNILSIAGAMLLTIADDMKTTFLKLLTEPQIVTMFLDKNKDVSNADKLLNSLAQHLHGNTAMYFVARYGDAIGLLDELITETAVAAGELEAAQLVAVARAKAPVSTSTRTAEMLAHISSLERYLSPSTSEKLRQLIGRIENAVSKESASKRLHENRASGSLAEGQQ